MINKAFSAWTEHDPIRRKLESTGNANLLEEWCEMKGYWE